MCFQRSDHKDVGNTCKALLHGTQRESKTHLQILCKAVATTSVRQERNAPIYLLVMFCLYKRDGHTPVIVVWGKITSPSCLGSSRARKRAKRWWLSLQSSPGRHPWVWHSPGCVPGVLWDLHLKTDLLRTPQIQLWFTDVELTAYFCQTHLV